MQINTEFIISYIFKTVKINCLISEGNKIDQIINSLILKSLFLNFALRQMSIRVVFFICDRVNIFMVRSASRLSALRLSRLFEASSISAIGSLLGNEKFRKVWNCLTRPRSQSATRIFLSRLSHVLSVGKLVRPFTNLRKNNKIPKFREF